jgi:hypothetical protein
MMKQDKQADVIKSRDSLSVHMCRATRNGCCLMVESVDGCMRVIKKVQVLFLCELRRFVMHQVLELIAYHSVLAIQQEVGDAIVVCAMGGGMHATQAPVHRGKNLSPMIDWPVALHVI